MPTPTDDHKITSHRGIGLGYNPVQNTNKHLTINIGV